MTIEIVGINMQLYFHQLPAASGGFGSSLDAIKTTLKPGYKMLRLDSVVRYEHDRYSHRMLDDGGFYSPHSLINRMSQL